MVLYMDRKMKRWELALMCGRAVRTGTGGDGWTGSRQRLADQVIRLHVIANSDSPEDQALKLEVRDQVLAHAEELYPGGGRPGRRRAAALQEHLPELAAAGQRGGGGAGLRLPGDRPQLTADLVPHQGV